ncbi:MAG TPA: Lrp/AsnC family transcriptional regulator [Alphaproteobacteria bacterium]|nr:Lrp/AsnC family transcriptional regulator [Alphaproteobacteria bacterium]
MTIRRLDETDEKLLGLLRANARLPAAALARELGISRPAVHERIKKLEKAGVIQGYTIVAAKTPTTALRAHVLVGLDPKLHDRAIAALRAFRAIRRLHTVSGDFDLLLELTATTAEELDDVLTRIGHVAGVKQTKTSVLLSTRLDREN